MSQCLLVAALEAQCEAVKLLYNGRIGSRLPAAWLIGYFISGSARYALGVVYAAGRPAPSPHVQRAYAAS
jgi:hypothetical protein